MTTNETSAAILDGLTADEYRELGRALLATICAIDKLTRAPRMPRRRLSGYECASRCADRLLDILAECYLDAYHEKAGKHPDEDGAYPYPRYKYPTSAGAVGIVPPQSATEEASREQFETFTTEYGIALDAD